MGLVAHATSLFGASAAPFFPSARAFTSIWVAPYLLAGHGVVAERAGEVVGYCIGVDRPGAYLCGLLRRLPTLLADIAAGRCPGWTTGVRFGARLLLHPAPHAPARRFPAHLHVALLAEERGTGLGRRLLVEYLDAAAERGVRGLQLATTARHGAALGLYRSIGFETYARRTTPFWRPWTGHDETHVVCVIDPRRRAPKVPGAASG